MNLNIWNQSEDVTGLGFLHLAQEPSGMNVMLKQAPLVQEDRFREGQEMLHRELEVVRRLRAEINKMSDTLLGHILILRNIRENYLY